MKIHKMKTIQASGIDPKIHRLFVHLELKTDYGSYSINGIEFCDILDVPAGVVQDIDWDEPQAWADPFIMSMEKAAMERMLDKAKLVSEWYQQQVSNV